MSLRAASCRWEAGPCLRRLLRQSLLAVCASIVTACLAASPAAAGDDIGIIVTNANYRDSSIAKVEFCRK
jgi:hypothetical protein